MSLLNNRSANSFLQEKERIHAWFQGAGTPDPGLLDTIIQALDAGVLRIATPHNAEEKQKAEGSHEKKANESVRSAGRSSVSTPQSKSEALSAWTVHTWLQEAILLYFKTTNNQVMGDASLFSSAVFYDKVPLKTTGWEKEDFDKAGFRLVPGAIVRRGSFVGPRAVVMPGFINIGAYVGGGTMVDTGARVGSCAQIGKNCHLSGGVGIGGVLEPPGAKPVIIEDHCFIGAQSQVVEGAYIGAGSVLGMGTLISASTKVIDRQTGQIYQGYVPAGSVVVPGSYLRPEQQAGGQEALDSKANADGQRTQNHLPQDAPKKNKHAQSDSLFYETPENPLTLSLQCAVIIKKTDARTQEKTALNPMLRAESTLKS